METSTITEAPVKSRKVEPDKPAQSDAEDPNLADPRLLVNRACIYERRLPGGAYITAHIQRLQHGYYSSPNVSDTDYAHVDFVAVSFVFHAPNTPDHRFKSATIRARVQGAREVSTSPFHPYGYPPGNPRFLMHAPHLIYGAVSPENLQWDFSLAGSLGIANVPVSASFTPAGSLLGSYRHYEMMKIQGSARTLRSSRGRRFDVEAGEIVWSLEENSLQNSGLPREFAFAMLIHRPREESRINFSIEVDPVVQAWFGTYPAWWLAVVPKYRPRAKSGRRGMDFREEIGQRFEPVDDERGFNFANLVSSFDAYVHLPGKNLVSPAP